MRFIRPGNQWLISHHLGCPAQVFTHLFSQGLLCIWIRIEIKVDDDVVVVAVAVVVVVAVVAAVVVVVLVVLLHRIQLPSVVFEKKHIY